MLRNSKAGNMAVREITDYHLRVEVKQGVTHLLQLFDLGHESFMSQGLEILALGFLNISGLACSLLLLDTTFFLACSWTPVPKYASIHI